MPAAADLAASVERDDETLRFAGALTRAQVPALWTRLRGEARARVLDLHAVSAVDSAGLALLAQLAAADVEILGHPPGLDELRAAYRLDGKLRFASA